jgi:hypothetical protein
MDVKGWIWKVALALLGIVAGVYVGQELIGGALGAMAAGAIIVAFCYPMIQNLIEFRKQKAERLRR